MKMSDFRPTKRNIVQFLAYMVGGTAYFWSGYAVFAFCYSGLGWNWLYAKLMADLIGWTLNYVIQRYWAFANPALKKHEARTAGRYAAITAFNFALDYAIIWGLKSMGVSPYVGFFISAGFFTVWNYLWYRFWVFFGKRNVSGGVNKHG
ncbi:MAG TPA: GtrA family protein [Candidatus Saccharimonadales bacterium]|nr:GtrA family protein [Candidatus Saccharimonadales bacterium]